MPAFGEAILAIIVEIIRSTIGTGIVITKNIVLLFQILAINVGRASPLVILIAAAVLFLVLFALFKFFKAETKTLIIALIIFSALVLLAVLL